MFLSDSIKHGKVPAAFDKLLAPIEEATGGTWDVYAEPDWGVRLTLRDGETRLGYFRMSMENEVDRVAWKLDPGRTAYRLASQRDCRPEWREAGAPSHIWIVSSVEFFESGHRNRGYGKRIYRAFIAYARANGGGVLGPDECVGGSTSRLAKGVWRSLCESDNRECVGPWIVL